MQTPERSGGKDPPHKWLATSKRGFKLDEGSPVWNTKIQVLGIETALTKG